MHSGPELDHPYCSMIEKLHHIDRVSFLLTRVTGLGDTATFVTGNPPFPARDTGHFSVFPSRPVSGAHNKTSRRQLMPLPTNTSPAE